MADIEEFINRFTSGAKQPQNYRWLVPLAAFIILFFVVKGCFSTPQNKEGHYRVARDGTWYPLDFYGKSKNVLAFSDDLIIEIALRKNLKIQLVSANSGDLLEQLDEGSDAIFTTITPDVNLTENFMFSEPYYNLGTVLIVDTDSKAKSLADMKYKYVGVRRGSSVLFSIHDRPEFTVIPYDNFNAMLEDIVRDKIDGALVNQLNAYTFTNAYYRGKLKVVTPPLTREGLRLMTKTHRKGTLLIQAFNEGLEELKADGTWNKLVLKWDLYDSSALPK